jgi:hypothetical protein
VLIIVAPLAPALAWPWLPRLTSPCGDCLKIIFGSSRA